MPPTTLLGLSAIARLVPSVRLLRVARAGLVLGAGHVRAVTACLLRG
jgi:hypothetical protein